MTIKARITRLENGRSGIQPPEGYPDDWPWEAPWFVVRGDDDQARADAEMERWREEIDRDRARGRTTFGFDFRHGVPGSTDDDEVQP